MTIMQIKNLSSSIKKISLSDIWHIWFLISKFLWDGIIKNKEELKFHS